MDDDGRDRDDRVGDGGDHDGDDHGGDDHGARDAHGAHGACRVQRWSPLDLTTK